MEQYYYYYKQTRSHKHAVAEALSYVEKDSST
jgi:hypothetical protein